MVLIVADAEGLERTFSEPLDVATLPAPEILSASVAFVLTRNKLRHKHKANVKLKNLFKKITSHGKDT